MFASQTDSNTAEHSHITHMPTLLRDVGMAPRFSWDGHAAIHITESELIHQDLASFGKDSR
jgi:hypothetical protein